MEITYIGHSCFKIKGKTLSIVTDPYDPKKVGYKLPKLEADVLTLSHDHYDHNFAEGVSDYKLLIDRPGEYEMNEVFIHTIPTFHDDKSGKERGGNLLTFIEIDGFNILHCGDLGHELDQDTLEKIYSVDVLLIPVGGTYTIDAKTAVKVISSLEPGLIIPMHYQTAELTDLAKELAPVQKFLQEMGIEGAVKKEDKLKITSKSDIPEETQVVILNPQH